MKIRKSNINNVNKRISIKSNRKCKRKFCKRKGREPKLIPRLALTKKNSSNYRKKLMSKKLQTWLAISQIRKSRRKTWSKLQKLSTNTPKINSKGQKNYKKSYRNLSIWLLIRIKKMIWDQKVKLVKMTMIRSSDIMMTLIHIKTTKIKGKRRSFIERRKWRKQ